MELRTGLHLTEATQDAWGALVKTQGSKTRMRLKNPFIVACGIQDGEVSMTIPADTEVMLFCNMTGSYKQASTALKRRTLGTFYVQGSIQLSIMSDHTVKVTNPQQTTIPRSELERARTPRDTLVGTLRW